MLSDGDCCERTAPVAKSELSASTRKGRLSSGNMRIGAKTTHLRIASKADLSASFQCQSELFRVRSNNGRARSENPWMKRRCKGNLAVLRLITQASKGGSKENI